MKRYAMLAAAVVIAAGCPCDVAGGFYPALVGIAVLMALAAAMAAIPGTAPCDAGY